MASKEQIQKLVVKEKLQDFGFISMTLKELLLQLFLKIQN